MMKSRHPSTQWTVPPKSSSESNRFAYDDMGRKSVQRSFIQVAIHKLRDKFDLHTRIDWIRIGLKTALLLLFLTYSMQQSIDLLITYYSNSVEINLEILRPENLTLPAISLCFVYRHNFTQTPTTIGDYLKQTPSYNDLVQSCTVLDETTYSHINCSQVTRVQTVINRKYKCFSLFRANSMVGNKTELTYPLKSIKSFEWLNIKLNRLSLVLDVVGIAVHNNSDTVHPDLSDQSYVEIIRYWYDDGRVSRVTFTYSASALMLLPKPFTSKCIDYTELQLPPQGSSRVNLTTESQKNLLESCVAQKYEATHSGLFPMTVFAGEKEAGFKAKYKDASAHMTRDDYAVDQKIECRKEYPFPQCNSVNYAMKIKTTAYDNSPEEMEVVLYPPTGNQINLNEVPRHEFREMIAMISGIFSFWIGISVVSIVTPMVPFLISFFSRCKSSSPGRSTSPSLSEEQWFTRNQLFSGSRSSKSKSNSKKSQRSSSRLSMMPSVNSGSPTDDVNSRSRFTPQAPRGHWDQVSTDPNHKSMGIRNQSLFYPKIAQYGAPEGYKY